MRKIDRFAEELSKHGRFPGDLGGDVRACARRIGIDPHYGNTLMSKIRKRLGVPTND